MAGTGLLGYGRMHHLPACHASLASATLHEALRTSTSRTSPIPLLPCCPPPQVYVIGGLVDRTVRKGASLRLAQRCGARAVRLPIAEHLGSAALGNSKGVLNVNDVFNALLAVHAGDSWLEALDAAIPQRFRIQQPGSEQQGQQVQQQATEPQQQVIEERQEQQQLERRQKQATPGSAAALEDAQDGGKERQPSAVRRQRPPAALPCGCCLS